MICTREPASRRFGVTRRTGLSCALLDGGSSVIVGQDFDFRTLDDITV